MNILEEIPNCPVEWKELGEVAHSIKTGLNPRKFFQLNTSDASNYYITVREIRGHKIVPSEKTDLINNDGLMLCQNRSNLEIGDVLFTGTGTIGNVAIIEKTPTNWNIKEGVYAIKPKKEQICSKFLMYLFESEKIRKDIEGRKAGGTVKSVSMAEMKKIKIPIPPLEIQEKIVQTLDKFTDYVTELTSELTSRKKQYSFYRDKLLSFEDEVYQVEWKTLDAVSERTSNISWNKIGDDEKFKYIDLSSVDRVSNKITETTSITKSTAPSRAQKIVKSNDIILGTTRPTLKRFTKITDDYNDQICSTGFYVFRTNGEVLPNYVYHIFSSSDFYKYLEENQSGASYPAISDALVKKYKIPVPSLEIQSRIVQVLDNFDMVCNDLNIGLPKEIELRQKQYEYFREKLLTFVAEGEYTESRVEEWDNSAIIKLLQWVFGPIQVELGAMARYSKARIEATKLTSENYVGVDNLLQDRNGKTVATYLPEQGSFTGYDQDDILIGNIRPYLKKIWYANQSGGTNGDVLVIQNLFPSCLESQYLYYVLSDDRFFSYDMQYAKGSKMPRGDKAAIMQYSFILPSLSEQERIVSILDNFNTLTNSLSEGLPKEIELRQKQYEYWREQLLNFTR